MKIVLDSDVVIAGLISSRGAGYFLLTNFLPHYKIKIVTSQKQIKEVEKVLARPEFSWTPDLKLWQRFKRHASAVRIFEKLTATMADYLVDLTDTHILASAVTGKAKFLLTYNLKHYHQQKIRQNFNIRVVHPGFFLQFLRSAERFSD